MSKTTDDQLDDKKLPAYNIHPGEDLQDKLEARNMSQKQLADLIGLKPSMLNEIIKGKRSITPSIAIKLEAGLSNSAEYWLKGQQMYDLYKVRQENQETIANIREKRVRYWRDEEG